MPNYRKKLLSPLTDEQFIQGMASGKFVQPKHIGFVAFLHYTAVRCSEALGQKKENFSQTRSRLYVDVGERLKHSKETQPLRLRLDIPYMPNILEAVDQTRAEDRVWPYCRMTGYNIVKRVFAYPHYHRLSRITFLLEKFGIVAAQNWTGLTLQALDYYVGRMNIDRVGDSIGRSPRIRKRKKRR